MDAHQDARYHVHGQKKPDDAGKLITVKAVRSVWRGPVRKRNRNVTFAGWLPYTMTAAATGTPDDAGIGWRKALQHALIENPLKDTPFLSDRSTGSLKLRQRSKGDASQRKLQIIDFSNNAPNVSVSTSQNAMTAGGARWT
jgi:hypothetical protein